MPSDSLNPATTVSINKHILTAQSDFWTGLRHYYDPIIPCTGATCDGKPSWSRTNPDPFNFAVSGLTAINYNIASDIPQCGLYGKDNDKIIDEPCHSVSAAYTACQVNCRVGFCPQTHPFAFDDGKSCCKWFTCSTNGLRCVSCFNFNTVKSRFNKSRFNVLI